MTTVMNKIQGTDFESYIQSNPDSILDILSNLCDILDYYQQIVA